MFLGANVCDSWLPCSDGGGVHIYRVGERLEGFPDEWFDIFRSLGVSLLQIDRDLANTVETSPGRWDWMEYEYFFWKIRRKGFRTIFFPHCHFPPEWFEKTDKFTGVRCLKHDKYLPCFSLWSPHVLPWFERYVKNFKKFCAGKKMGNQAIYLGIYGDFGEAMFPAGDLGIGREILKHDRGLENGHIHCDFWCNDDYAKKSFGIFLKNKYGRISNLNSAYGLSFKSFREIKYPVSPAKDNRRYWLDFIYWYYQSMSDFCGNVASIYRKHFPETLLMLPLGGGVEPLQIGQDNTALPKVMKQYDVHMRSTAGGVAHQKKDLAVPEKFTKTYLILKRTATACKFYRVPLWLEPPYPPMMDANAIKCRIFESVSCGAVGYYDWSWSIYRNREVYQKYKQYLKVEKPLVDIAVFFPTTWHRLHPEKALPELWEHGCSEVRKFFDYDVLDERLVEDGALANYRILIIFEGQIMEESVLKKIIDWVQGGGMLLTYDTGVVQTVEGDTRYNDRLFNPDSHLSEKDKVWRLIRNDFRRRVSINKIGRGYSVLLKQKWEGGRDFHRLCSGIVNRLIYPYTETPFQNQIERDIFVTVFEGKAGFLNLTTGTLKRRIGNRKVTVPPFSMKIVEFP